MSMNRLLFDGKKFSATLVGGPAEALDLPGAALLGDLRPVAFAVFQTALVSASYIFGYGHILFPLLRDKMQDGIITQGVLWNWRLQ